ncbi:MAG: galactose-1-phosphate uridylyltransferase [Patescibacteria group bacterium]
MGIVHNNKSEIRRDYFLNRYVIITPSRTKRPRDVVEKSEYHAKKDIFAPENIEKDLITDHIGGQKNWHVLSLLNKYPAVSLASKKAYGTQEVIVEHRENGIDLGHMSQEHIVKVLKMYQKRTTAIAKEKEIDYILIFKNQGGPAGASILHSHSQIFATTHIPPDVYYELDKAQEYKLKHGTSPYGDIIEKEEQSPRHIYSDSSVVAIAPYASSFHYEAWIFTRRQLDNITRLNETELKSLAKAMKMILQKLADNNISYNFFMHQVVSFKEQHFYIKIQPRDSIWAGVELGSGLVINSISPEAAAKFYKDKS